MREVDADEAGLRFLRCRCLGAGGAGAEDDLAAAAAAHLSRLA